MTLQGGQEGTAFGSLTIEGEDLIRIEFERPKLDLHIDPRQTQGLDLGDAREVLDRERPDLTTPLLAASAFERSPYLGRAWLDELSDGPVARFRPQLDGVESWKLTVADSRGETVAEFGGRGKPPNEIAWNGLSTVGEPSLPGLTYSYVLEAHDRAGNKRNFVGEGFELRPYRLQADGALLMMFSGDALRTKAHPRQRASMPAPVVLETASWINQAGVLDQPVQVKAIARSFELANALTQNLVRELGPRVLGDPARMQALTEVAADAPAEGAPGLRQFGRSTRSVFGVHSVRPHNSSLKVDRRARFAVRGFLDCTVRHSLGRGIRRLSRRTVTRIANDPRQKLRRRIRR
jgi:hypothetical protein